ncbi:unnamed protein product [Didymodactylos carnosus]|uniref:EF-hand domain-containing protein n=1 Tax=Didymodactylos carnosus TaxID=1234261 RepID=A0A813X6P9_9BILA|nr:unnamed protein product [Didymodactylos carnosus]CAF0868598.1 unnamed protein product [Didymodactylos carnosus]CAF3601359.1 unnamed protein product [Didymodactylos carnosus]CAF3656068.1 unnamed protein product [Didymodactylos carnosus]
MGSTPSIPDTIDLDDIIASTGLAKNQISALWVRFEELDQDVNGEGKGSKGYLTLDDLSRVPKFDENPMASRLMKVIFDDFGTDGKLNFKHFVQFMSIFSRRESSLRTTADTSKKILKNDESDVSYSMHDTNVARKIKFIFRMYDIDRDGKISKEDAQETLKMMVGKISDEEASIIAERVIGEFTDNNPNSTVDLSTFENTLKILDFNEKMGLKLLK